MQNNCYDCKNRHVGCHSTCEIYKSFKEHLNELKKIEKRNKNKINMAIEDVIARKRRY